MLRFLFQKHFWVSSGEKNARFFNPLASLSRQPQPRSLLHPRVLLQGPQREVQRGVGVRSPGHVQRREPPVPHLRAQGQLHRLPRRDASLPQRGEGNGRLRGPVAIATSGCQSSRVLLLPPPQGCSGSICEKYGLEACTCASQDGKDETELCHVCCMEKSESFHLFHLRLSHRTEVF